MELHCRSNCVNVTPYTECLQGELVIFSLKVVNTLFPNYKFFLAVHWRIDFKSYDYYFFRQAEKGTSLGGVNVSEINYL